MNLAQKLREVRAEICANRKEIAQVRLESAAGTANPYSLMAVFGKGHLVTRAGASVYVTRCSPVEVMPRETANCTAEIPVTWRGQPFFVDAISFTLKPMGTPLR